MYSPFVRSLFILGAIGLAIYFALQGRFTETMLFVASALLFVWTFYRHGSVLRAFTAYRKGEITLARRNLHIADSSRWDATNSSYYHLLTAVFCLADGNVKGAEEALTEIDPAKFRSDDHRGLFLYYQAEIAYRRKLHPDAKRILDEALRSASSRETLDLIHALEQKLEEISSAHNEG